MTLLPVRAAGGQPQPVAHLGAGQPRREHVRNGRRRAAGGGGGDALHPRGAGRGAPDAVPKSGRGGIENKHSTKR